MSDKLKILKGEKPDENERSHKILRQEGHPIPRAKTVADEPLSKHKREHRRLERLKGRRISRR